MYIHVDTHIIYIHIYIYIYTGHRSARKPSRRADDDDESPGPD